MRFLAFSVDLMLLSCLAALIFAAAIFGYLASGKGFSFPQILCTMFVFFPFFGFLFLFYFTSLTTGGEATVGKKLFGLRVVRKDGSELGPARALVRSISYLISVSFLLVSILMVLLLEGTTPHDLITDTQVVREGM
jgi:uncharacterized RDD family membrane protein YckC